MAIRVEIHNGNFIDFRGSEGHGRTGQIRKAFWLSRSITVNGQNLNRGSLVDFLNTRLPQEAKLSKGWFFGLIGGSSDARIREAFNRVALPQAAALQPQARTNTDSSLLTALKNLQECAPSYLIKNDRFVYLPEQVIVQRGGICLVPNQSTFSDTLYHGLVVSKEKEMERWVLHICPGGGYCEYSLEEYIKIMPIAIKKLEELKITPDAFVIDGRHSGETLANFIAWQRTV